MDQGQLLLKVYAELLAYVDQVQLSRDEIIGTQFKLAENAVHRWREKENENESLRTLVRSFEKELETLQMCNREVKAELLEARSQIASLVATNQAVQSEKQVLEQQVSAVRTVLLDTPSLTEKSRKQLEFITERNFGSSRASGVSVTGIDFDKTDESSGSDNKPRLQTNWKECSVEKKTLKVDRKRSISVSQIALNDANVEFDDQASKRSKDDLDVEKQPTCETETKHVNVTPKKYVILQTPLTNKSASEPDLADDVDATKPCTPYANYAKSIPDLYTTPTPVKRIIATPNTKKKHLFLSKTVLRTETCDVCEKKISFGRVLLRCLECKTQVHQECRNNATVPCVTRTPTSKNAKGKLTDYVPPTEPFIPHIVIHLVGEIERRGLACVGLYRVPGTDSKVKDLLDRFLFSRGVPNVKLIEDVTILTGCLKKFLQQLKEPLIPYTSRAEMIRAAVAYTDTTQQMRKIHEAIVQLPLPNRDTLTFIILHLQKVAAHSATNKMPISNLAKIFGPTIISGSSSGATTVTEMMDESDKQEKVMNLLLSLPRDYWTQYVDVPSILPVSVDRTNVSVMSSRNNSRLKTPTPRGKAIQPPWR